MPSKTPPRVAVSILNWNAFAETAQSLDALRRLSTADVSVFVVDNGSTDGSPMRLKARFPEVEFIDLPDNIGFGAANNVVLRRAREHGIPFVWLLNNDAVPKPDALDAMLKRMQELPRAGAVGSLIRAAEPPHRVQAWGGGTVNTWLAMVRHAVTPQTPIDFLTGASLLLRMQALEETGFFDEAFFLYWEDTDLCCRLKDAGWILAVADGTVFHQGSATTGRFPRQRAYQSARSFVLFLRKHESFPFLKSLTAITFQSALKLFTGKGAAALGFWQGWASARTKK
ncbi:MAG: glycosyltransferase family 2 protein [Verrucomicrobiota bacterium]|nr:glycosyltransferase family 2 protein [Verrucomicrobiota bacterium]